MATKSKGFHPFQKIKMLGYGGLLLTLWLAGSGMRTAYGASGPWRTLPLDTVTVPLGGNAWMTAAGKPAGDLTDQGIEHWKDKNTRFTVYVRFAKTGSVNLSLRLDVPQGKSLLRVTALKHAVEIAVAGQTKKEVKAGVWNIPDTGYVAFQIACVSATGNVFANIQSLVLEGTAVDGRTTFVRNNEGNFFYWGRRGPSVHLNYALPPGRHAEWFYGEVTVPRGQDVTGSYFMVDGFADGYFGMQVNSPTERHILFSVWSPYKTDDPRAIPEDQKIQLLKKGKGVHAGEFGNEGSGGQSYLNYPWKAGTTYKFLLHGAPDGPDHTRYSAYFFTPETAAWELIASFRRPHTHGWLTQLYSFLENFEPAHGDQSRSALFSNQWICTDTGAWMELNKALFTADNTARIGYRMDYGGGIKGNRFFLRNCGFFNDYTPVDTWLIRPLTGKKPEIGLRALP